MLRQSLILFLEKLPSCNLIENFDISNALKKLERYEFHTILWNEMTMLPIPKVNRDDIIALQNIGGSHFLERAVERVSEVIKLTQYSLSCILLP